MNRAEKCAEELRKIKNENYTFVDEEVDILVKQSATYIEMEKKLLPKSQIMDYLEKQKQKCQNLYQWAKNKAMNEYKMTEGDNNMLYFDNISFPKFPNYIPGPIINESYNKPKIKSNDMINNLLKQLTEDFNILESEISKIRKGDWGEENVAKYFSLFTDKYTVINNKILSSNDAFAETSETDTFIITDKGIFVCEIKNWGNEREGMHIYPDGTWFKMDSKYHDLMKLKSPVEQNTRHVITLEKFLKNNGINVPIYPIIVMANQKVTIKNESREIILKVSDVYNYIEKIEINKPISNEVQNKIIQLLNECEISERYFKCYDFESKEDIVYNMFEKAFMLSEQEFKTRELLIKKANSQTYFYKVWYHIGVIALYAFAFGIIGVFISIFF